MRILSKLFIVILLLLGFIFISSDLRVNDYCEGWEEGHCEGWRDVKGQFSVCPVPPICPVPKVNCDRGYRCGYNRGFKRGRRDALNSEE